MKEGRQRASEREGSMFDRWILHCLINAEERWEPVPPVWQWRLAGVQLEMDLWTADTWRHIPELHWGSTQDEELETASTDHFTALFGQTVWKCMYNTPAMHCGELLFPVVSPAVGHYFWWPHKIRDTTLENLSLVWLMLAIQITKNASWFHV